MTYPIVGPLEWRSRVRLVDEVVTVMRDRIYSGQHKPGERLRQAQLADELQISRTPLREALRVLERERILEPLPRGGVRVISPDREALLAAYEFREVLDGVAARLAARQTTKELAVELRGSLALQMNTFEPWDPSGYTHENVAFHTRIYHATRNEYVIANLHVMRMTAQVFIPVQLIEPTRAISAIEEHREIAARIDTGDEEGAERAARSHIRATIASLARHTFAEDRRGHDSTRAAPSTGPIGPNR